MKVVLIGCGGDQKKGTYNAEDLYKGTIFKRNWKEADLIHRNAKKYIVSSFHGLLDPKQQICDYNVPYPKNKIALKAWAQGVVNSLLNKGFNPYTDELILYTLKDVGKAIVDCFPVLRYYEIISYGRYGRCSKIQGVKP